MPVLDKYNSLYLNKAGKMLNISSLFFPTIATEWYWAMKKKKKKKKKKKLSYVPFYAFMYCCFYFVA